MAKSHGIAVETVNRDGHWTREFTHRSQIWSIVEHWAAEGGYRLIANRNNRRMYLKGKGDPFYSTYIDIRQTGSKVVLTAWITTTLWSRLANLFRLPKEMDLTPTGFFGVRKRRETCRELNAVLERLKQPEIFESDTFHVSDIDRTILVLAALSAGVGGSFLLPLVAGVEIKPGLANALMAAIGEPLAVLGTMAAVLLAVQWLVSWKVPHVLARWGSFAVLAAIYSVTTISLFTGARGEMRQAKLSQHCIYQYQENACLDILKRATPEERTMVRQRLRDLERNIVRLETWKPRAD